MSRERIYWPLYLLPGEGAHAQQGRQVSGVLPELSLSALGASYGHSDPGQSLRRMQRSYQGWVHGCDKA